MAAIYELWSSLKIYVVYYFVGGCGGIVCLMMMSRRLRFIALLKSFFVASFGGFMGGILAKSCGLSMELQTVAAGFVGFAGGLGVLFLFVVASKKLGIDVSSSIKDALRLQDAIAEVNENIIHGDTGVCPEKPVENGILTALVLMGVLSDREAQGICDGAGSSLLLRLLERGSLTKDQYERLKTAFSVEENG